MENLQKVLKKLENIFKNKKIHIEDVFFPASWSAESTNSNLIISNPALFFMKQINWIISNKNHKSEEKTQPIIYNFLPRFTTTFDHNQDNNINNITKCFKETGTFLKSIAILPYLYKLGVDTIHLLPITAIGKDGRKGNLGSPYSISNPYKLDENLGEELLELSIEEQFAAFVEAAHVLNIKVVVEFVFRTASKDSELALENPHWFYWIKENTDNFTSPNFNKSVLEEIKEKVRNKSFLHLPAPEPDYINLFSISPVKVIREKNILIGELSNGEKVKIPGAFADWPPDDIQPAWSDVTYLKLYDSPDFNYMAYNTIRMYDENLALEKHEIKDLWSHIENIVPYYQQKFGIDGVMVDMGHSLPEKLMSNIIKKAREINPKFIFWEENFVPNENSVKSGYDAVIGYFPFDEHDYYKIQNIIRTLEKKEFPIPCFATSETHNTPRTASRNPSGAYNELIYAINSFLPLPLFIHSGFELCETFPVNTGLGFENIDTSEYTTNKLALFSVAALDWLSQNNTNIINAIINLNKIRQKYFDITTNNIKLLDSKHENILFFSREDKNKNNIYFVGNFSDIQQKIKLEILDNSKKIKDISTGLALEPELAPEVELELPAWSYKILI